MPGLDPEEFLQGDNNPAPPESQPQEPFGATSWEPYGAAPQEPPGAAPQEPDRYSELAGRLDTLTQTMNALLLQQRQQPPLPPPQQSPPPQPQGWQPKEFLTKEDAAMLLVSQDPAQQLNKVFNNIANTLYSTYTEELRRRDAALEYLYRQQVERAQAEERARLAQQNQQRFFQLHPEVGEYAYLVPLEAQALAHESQQNPIAYVNKTDVDIYNILAQRVMARVAAIQARAQTTQQQADQYDETYTAPQRGAAQRTQMERGSGTRVSPQATSRDPNKRALTEMARFLRRVG